MSRLLKAATAIGLLLIVATPGEAAAQATSTQLQVPIVYITQKEDLRLPLSLLDSIIEDEGVQGARLGIDDNQTTGRFLKQDYELAEALVPKDGDLVAAFKEQLADGRHLFVADVHADQLLALADTTEAADAVIFNIRAPDDALRNDQCRPNVFHVIPSRAMKADALAQYLAWKKWRNWFLVYGHGEGDLKFAEAVRRSAKKFGAKIVEDREFKGDAPSARTDTGHVQIQTQMPVFTQGAPDYDVLMVADESDIFGEYLPYRTWDPRPVVGTQGLIPTAWHRSQEQWGATQIQRRFEKLAGRWMTERDYAGWVAVRSIGEVVTRTGTIAPAAVRSYLRSDKFDVGAFKGQGLTFRSWNQQMRQPILLAAPRSLVSVSPQNGFLHPKSFLDTMGFDEPESSCHLDK